MDAPSRGRQVAIATTHPSQPANALSGAMLSLWSYETFRYARADFGLDTSPTHALEPLASDTEGINTQRLDCGRLLNRLRSRRASLRHREGQAPYYGNTNAARALQAEPAVVGCAIAELSRHRSEIPARIPAEHFDAAERIDILPESVRPLHDTLRMIAYWSCRDRAAARGGGSAASVVQSARRPQGPIPQKRLPAAGP